MSFRMKNRTPSRLSFLIIAWSLAFTAFLLPSPAQAQNPPECFYNACSVGPICDLGQQYYSPGDFVYNRELSFPVGELKFIPQTYYEEYKDFACKADECDSAYGDTWYCTSAIIGGVNGNRIQQCPNFAKDLPYCNLNDCQGNPYCVSSGCLAPGDLCCGTSVFDTSCFVTETRCVSSDSSYCDVGVRRYCDDISMVPGWYQCYSDGKWGFPSPPVTGDSGICHSEPQKEPPPWMYCIGGELGVPGSGRWQDSPFEFEQHRCEDVLVNLTAGMTPGYVKTYTPHLFDIWKNTVASTQAIFSIFRTQLDKEIYDWPGESSIAYDFDPFAGSGFAMAGYPPTIHPGAAAKIYFRYLGYIHCAKENLLQKLSSVFNDPPYVYYDARCDADLW